MCRPVGRTPHLAERLRPSRPRRGLVASGWHAKFDSMTPLELRAFACGSGDRGTARYSVAFHGETTSGAGAFKLIGQRVFGIACGHPDGRASTPTSYSIVGCGRLDLGFQQLHDLVKSALERALAAIEDLEAYRLSHRWAVGLSGTVREQPPFHEGGDAISATTRRRSPGGAPGRYARGLGLLVDVTGPIGRAGAPDTRPRPASGQRPTSSSRRFQAAPEPRCRGPRRPALPPDVASRGARTGPGTAASGRPREARSRTNIVAPKWTGRAGGECG